ncbi:MAG TPA: hypothetical protein VMF90_07675 [Rhizobiaceae bacterium]|nr:hypothetical protein [Rhizobiaceae bacterium]
MKLITAAALSLAMMTGAALAQATSSNNPGETKDFWSDKAMVGALYTDDSMTTLRTGDDFKAAWTAMTPDSQAAMKKQCEAEDNRGTNAEAICSQIMTN